MLRRAAQRFARARDAGELRAGHAARAGGAAVSLGRLRTSARRRGDARRSAAPTCARSSRSTSPSRRAPTGRRCPSSGGLYRATSTPPPRALASYIAWSDAWSSAFSSTRPADECDPDARPQSISMPSRGSARATSEQPLGDPARAVQTRVGQEQHELVAAQSRQQVGAARAACMRPRTRRAR